MDKWAVTAVCLCIEGQRQIAVTAKQLLLLFLLFVFVRHNKVSWEWFYMQVVVMWWHLYIWYIICMLSLCIDSLYNLTNYCVVVECAARTKPEDIMVSDQQIMGSKLVSGGLLTRSEWLLFVDRQVRYSSLLHAGLYTGFFICRQEHG